MERKIIFNLVIIICLAVAGLMAAGCKEVFTNDRPWLEEADFKWNPFLHATADQTIVFDLESFEAAGAGFAAHGKKGRGGHHRLIRNTVSYLVRETDTTPFSFCIPAEEPYIQALELETADGQTVLRAEPGDDCTPITLETGRYRLHVLHDPESIDTGVKKAFLHRPRTRLFRTFQDQDDAALATSALPADLESIVFTGPNGMYVNDNSSSDFRLTCDYPHVYLETRWTLVPNSKHWKDWDGYLVTAQKTTKPAYLFACCDGDSSYAVADLTIYDKGNWQFTLQAAWTAARGITIYGPVVVDDSNSLVVDTDLPQTVYNAKYLGFPCSSSCDSNTLPLQEGEIALFSDNNYQGDAIVALTNAVEFSNFNVSGEAPAEVKSVRLGPNTFVRLFSEEGYNGDQVPVSSDTPSLNTTVGSFLIYTDAKTFTLATDYCKSCNLEGIDLSGDTLSEGVFTYSDFTNANLYGTNFTDADLKQTILTGANLHYAKLGGADLTNANLNQADLSGADLSSAELTKVDMAGTTLTDTNFQSAKLSQAAFYGTAPLSGTDFSNATLGCTSFAGTDQSSPWDLTGATFDVDPVVETDFSCRLSLKNTAILASTFGADTWRYLDLSGATIKNDTGGPLTLSTLDDPLDLSGAILSGVSGLSRVILDGADLGCATPTAANKNCTQLIDTDLPYASLKKANLVDAALNGANLNFANLTEANLRGAQLLKSPSTQTSASLQGAALKNANLADADLSGADLTNANWYSTSSMTCPGTTWSGKCASGQGATLSNADFNGAYLCGLDLSNATLQGADLGGAILAGVHFTGANMSRDPTTGAATSLDKAFLQGADFTDAITTGANFTSAYVDLSSKATLLFQLPSDNLEFTGFEQFTGKLPGCVEFTYSAPTSVPPTTSGNKCPDADNGPCSTTQWENPTTPIGEASPPSTTDPATGLSNGCKSTTMDINWILQ